MTRRLDPFDISDQELFKNYINIPLDTPNEEFLQPSKRQTTLAYRF